MIQHVFKPSRRRNGKRRVSRIWWGQYRLDGDSRISRVSLKTTDKRVAQQRLAELVGNLERERSGLIPTAAARAYADQPVLEHLDDYILDLETRKKSRDYIRHIKQRVSTLCADCEWSRLRDVTADSFVAWRSTQAKAPKTLNDYLADARTFLEWLKHTGRTETNPLASVPRVEARGHQSVERRAYTLDEVRRLLAACGPRRLLYLTAVNTGLRRAELRQLKWDDLRLDTDHPGIRVRAATSKNRKDSLLAIGPELAAELRAARAQSSATPSDPVFATMPSHHTLNRDLVRAGIERVDEMGRKVDFHAFRHTFATNLQVAGVPQRVAMELMRHSDPRLTAMTYLDSAALPVESAVAALPRFGDDAQLDAQELFSAGRSASPAVASGQTPPTPASPATARR